MVSSSLAKQAKPTVCWGYIGVQVMKILAVIPARGGSKGIAKKNIKLFNGRPLIHYAIKLAKGAERSGIIVGHIVSTDDKEIASVAEENEGNVPFLRPKELATDDSPVIDTIIHAVNRWQEHHKDAIDSVLILQPTNPLTAIEDVTNSVKHYLDNQPEAKCLISICDAQHIRLGTLYHKKGEYLEQILKEIDPVVKRQALKGLYWRNGAVYIIRRDLLLEGGKIIDDNPLYYEMPRARSVAIDDDFDWDMAEFLMNKVPSSPPEK